MQWLSRMLCSCMPTGLRSPGLMSMPAPQCGGEVGQGCGTTMSCSDAPWPGYACSTGYTCTRIAATWYQARRRRHRQALAVPVPAARGHTDRQAPRLSSCQCHAHMTCCSVLWSEQPEALGCELQPVNLARCMDVCSPGHASNSQPGFALRPCAATSSLLQ